MEENEALEHKLPNVESVGTETYQENVASVQMELPSSDPVFQPAVPATLSVNGTPMQQFAPIAPVITSTSTPPLAEDIDLIEKAWVEKAKDIVKATHGDPYSQNKELNKVKADYIKKRYDKDVKVIE